MSDREPCHYCEGKGYTEIRDCAGEVQRTDNCSFCEGLGFCESEEVAENKLNLGAEYYAAFKQDIKR